MKPYFLGKITGILLAGVIVFLFSFVLAENTLGSLYIGMFAGLGLVVPLLLANVLISVVYLCRKAAPNVYLWMWGPSLAVLVLLGFINVIMEFDESQPTPEERLRVGSFELGRWKIRYQSGESNSTPDDYYWNSIVRFRGKQIDFCSPLGWGGESLCDEKHRRGRFDHAYVVSDNPPALLLQYGGSSGNSDGELWLFTERDQKLEQQRVALQYGDGVRDLNGEKFKRDDEWDLRNQPTIILDDDNWLETAPLRHLELSRPFSTDYLGVAFRSPSGRQVARIGYSDLFGEDRKKFLLVTLELSDPLVPKVYVLEGPEAEKNDFRDHAAENFDKFFAWGPKNDGDIRALKPKSLRIRLIDAVIERNSLKTAPMNSHSPDETYFIPAATAVHLPALCETIFAGVPEASQVTNISSNEKSLDLGNWGTINLKATAIGVQIENPQSNHSAFGNQTTYYIDKVLQRAFYRGELSLAQSQKARKIRQQCQ